MDVREKLVELIKTGIRKGLRAMGDDRLDYSFEDVADYLISSGVTVQKWISVKDGLPKDREWVLVNHTGYATPKKAKYKDDFSPHLPVFLIDGDNGNKGKVTHWMPLPQPPKGE